MGFAPGGSSGIAVAEAAQESLEAVFGAAEVVDGIDPGAAEVADGFVGLVGDVDGGEFAGAQEAGEFDGVFFVGLDLVAGFGGDQGGGDDGAVNLQLKQFSGDPHAAAARFVTDVEVGQGDAPGLGDAAKHLLDARLAGDDAAVAADLALGAGIGDGDGSLFFMDVESDVEFRGRVWVRFHVSSIECG